MPYKIPETKLQQVIELRARGKNWAYITKNVGISKTSANTLSKDPEFLSKISKARDAYLEEWKSKLIGLVPLCQAAAIKILQGNNAQAQAKIMAMVWGALGFIAEKKLSMDEFETVMGTTPPPTAPIPEPTPENPFPDAVVHAQ
jgi:hypothetical protein